MHQSIINLSLVHIPRKDNKKLTRQKKGLHITARKKLREGNL